MTALTLSKGSNDISWVTKILVVAAMVSSCLAEECKHSHCVDVDCLQYKCWRIASKPWLQIQCELLSTYIVSDDPQTNETCFDLANVFGIREFCERTISNTDEKAPENIEHEKYVPVKSQVCPESSFMWPVAVGCFVAGCFLALVVVCITRCCCVFHARTKTDILNGQRTVGQSEFALLSEDQSPFSVSVDSGLSGSHDATSSALPSPGGTSQTTCLIGRFPDEPTTTSSEGFYASTQLSTIYSPPSDTSSRDYHSIQGNNYVLNSDSDSDFNGIKLHRVTLIRGEDIYVASSESSGDDYPIYKTRKLHGEYYPVSESSFKDYTSLVGDQESATYCDVDIEVDREQVEALLSKDGNRLGDENGAVKFRVRGLVFPKKATDLASINEYEAMGSKGSGHDYSKVEGAVGGVPEVREHAHAPMNSFTRNDVTRTSQKGGYPGHDPHDYDYHDYDVCADGYEAAAQKHEYHVLEPKGL